MSLKMTLDKIVNAVLVGAAITSFTVSPSADAKHGKGVKITSYRSGIDGRPYRSPAHKDRQVYCDKDGAFYFDKKSNCQRDYYTGRGESDNNPCVDDTVLLPGRDNECYIKNSKKKEIIKQTKQFDTKHPATKEEPKPVVKTATQAKTCTPNWEYGTWGTCQEHKNSDTSTTYIQIRDVTDKNNCGVQAGMDLTHQPCKPIKMESKKPEPKVDDKSDLGFAAYAHAGGGLSNRKTEDGNGNVWKFTGYEFGGDLGACLKLADKHGICLSGLYNRTIFNNNSVGDDGKATDIGAAVGWAFGDEDAQVGLHAGYIRHANEFSLNKDKFRTTMQGAEVGTTGRIRLTDNKPGFSGSVDWNADAKVVTVQKTGEDKTTKFIGKLAGGASASYITANVGTWSLGALAEYDSDVSGFKNQQITGIHLDPRATWNYKGNSVDVMGIIPLNGDLKRKGAGVNAIIKVTDTLGVSVNGSYVCTDNRSGPFRESGCNASAVFGFGTTQPANYMETAPSGYSNLLPLKR